MTPLDNLFDWFSQVPRFGSMKKVRGIWRDPAPEELLVLMQLGGSPADQDLDYLQVRALVLGKAGGNKEAGYIKDLDQLVQDVRVRLRTDYTACGIAQILLVGGIIGPGLTDNDRPWFELNLQLII